jgi:molybdate transport system substrate-binding protein
MSLRLPKSVDSDPRASQLLRDLTTHTRLLWQGSEIEVPVARMTLELAEALRSAYSAGQVVRSLEKAERTLAAEERGLQMADRQLIVPRGVRVSRLLLLANDGAERFYRQLEALLRRHGPRALAVLLEIDENGLGELLFGPRRVARLLMLEHKQAVGSVLLAMAGQWEDPGSANAQELKVYAAGATKEVVVRLAPEFTKATGIKVVPVYDTVGALCSRLLRGEKSDMVMLSHAALDTLQGKNLIAADSRLSLGSVAVALAVQKGASIPNISTPEALKITLLSAKSISYADPEHGATAGRHFVKVLDQLGIRALIADRTTIMPFGVEVIQAVADGRVELGVSQSSEISLHPGVSLVGRLPEPYALMTPYAAARLSGASENAKHFIDFLQTKMGAAALAEAGFSRG